jgi:subtilisin-like proprotein convertase family protein
VQQRDFFLTLLAGPSGVPTLSSPANNATNVFINPLLTWSAVAGSTGYDYQVALDNAFTQVVRSGNVGGTQFQVTTALAPDLQYFWRIRPVNTCGAGNWSSVFSFTTTGCFLLYSPDVPKAISASGTPTVFSDLVVNYPLTITDLEIMDLEGTHTWLDDLKFTLIPPSGQAQLFWDQPCSNQDNFDINFDDEAANNNWPCPPIDGQTYQPSNPLSVFDGLSSAGTWTMQVQDDTNQDGGSLNKWGLKVCGTPPCQLVVTQTGTSGPGSLRGAISCAQAGDTIILSAVLAGQTIDIGPVAQAIGKDLTIQAAAPDIGITGTGGRLLEVLAGIDLVLDGMILIAGTSTDGGAIQNSGNLVLQGVTVNPNPVVPGAILIRNDSGAQLTIAADCQINQ